jgi:hypothetical protein
MAYDPVDQYVVLFGGDNESTSNAYSDTWTFAGGTWTELSPSTSPPARYAGGMTWDAADGYLLLFGGHDYPSGVDYGDTWTFVHGTWTELFPTSAPAPRWRFAMAYDFTDRYVVLYGGTDNGTTYYADTWTFVGGNWTDISKLVSGSPPLRYRATMAWDPLGGYLVLFGGCTSSACTTPDQSTWTYLNLTWTPLSPSTKPAGRLYFGFTYDSVIGGIVLFGGSTNSAESTTGQDTWVFSDGNWTQITSSVGTAPSDRGFMMMAFDGADNYTLLFGGASSGTTVVPLGDTWILGPEVLARISATPSSADLGQAVQLNATPLAAHGSVSYNYTGLPAGCLSANVSILTCTPSAEGSFLVTVHDSSTAGGVSNASANLTVGSDPSITAFTANRTSVTAGSAVQLTLTPAGGTMPYRYSYSGLPAGCSSSNSPTPTCTPTGTGNFTIGASLTDAAGYLVTASLDLTVNARPSLTALTSDPQVVDVGQATVISITAAGGTAPLGYSFTGLPAGCVSADLASLSCTATVSGTFPIGATVTDADGWTASMVASLTVDPDPSVISFAAAPALLDLGGSIHVWLNASGGTGGLTYAYTGFPSGCVLGVASTGSCVPQVTGNFTITGTVTDGLGFSVHQTLVLTVNADPAVTLIRVTPAGIDVGQTAAMQVVYTGGTAPFSFSYTGLPFGCTGTATAFVNCTGSSPGSSSITVTLTDHLKQASSLAGTLIVYARPSIASFGATETSLTVGGTTTLSVAVTGGAGNDSFAYAGLPAGCHTTDASTLVCTPTAAGAFTVGVNVTDLLGSSAHAFLNLSVQSASSTSGGLGSSSTVLWIVVAVVVVAAIVGALVVMRRRRKQPPADSTAAAEPAWAEPPPDEAT